MIGVMPEAGVWDSRTQATGRYIIFHGGNERWMVMYVDDNKIGVCAWHFNKKRTISKISGRSPKVSIGL